MIRSDEGAVSTFIAVIALSLMMAAGLAIDGGRKVGALTEASHLAQSAARAGAQAIDIPTLRSTGEIALDQDRAIQYALEFLALAGATGTTTGTATVEGAAVTVTVTISISPVLLPIGEITVSATETATAVSEGPS